MVKQERNLDGFDEIKISKGMNVYLTQGNETKVSIQADENLLAVIETEVDGDVLKISTGANIRKAKAKKVFITLPNIDVIEAFAGSNVYAGNLNIENIEISASAGSNVKLEINAQDSKVSASAGSNVKLEGKSDKFTAKASSGSNIRAGNLKTLSSETKVSSGANIWLAVQNNIKASASSGGNIFYFGSPENTEITKSSGGNVIKK